MIVARKSPLFNSFFARHARSRILRTFHEVRVFGLENARATLESSPALVVANHTAWWDPMMAIALSNFALGADAYAMMDAKNLTRLPFFAKVGAFGVDLGDPADGARAIRYSAKLLDAPKKLVWIFPQGEERPAGEPLAFRAGSAEIARVAKRASVIPVALRYVFAEVEKPYAYVSFGPSFPPLRDVDRGRSEQESRVGEELSRIDRAVRGDRSGFTTLFRTRESAVAKAAERLLAWMAG